MFIKIEKFIKVIIAKTLLATFGVSYGINACLACYSYRQGMLLHVKFQLINAEGIREL